MFEAVCCHPPVQQFVQRRGKKDSRSSGIISISDRCWATLLIQLRPWATDCAYIKRSNKINSIQSNSKLFSHSQPSGSPAAKPHLDMTANSGYLTGAICISFMVLQSCWQMMSSQLRGLERLSKQCDCSNYKLQPNRVKPTSHIVVSLGGNGCHFQKPSNNKVDKMCPTSFQAFLESMLGMMLVCSMECMV